MKAARATLQSNGPTAHSGTDHPAGALPPVVPRGGPPNHRNLS